MQNQPNGSVARRRVMIFIDGSNLYHVLKQNTDKRNLDYKRFAQKLCGDRELIRTYYYNIRQDSPDNPKLAESQDRFLNALYETEYLEVKLGIWKQRGDTMVEKGVDVMIAADLISHAYEDHYDTAILVSGDADFYPALQVVKDTGKQVEVAAFDSNLSSEAARFSDVLIRFDKHYFDDLWMTSNQQSQNIRLAERRKLVTDEAASPNGEDKGASRMKTDVRRSFTERYLDRRSTYLPQTSKQAGSNGHSDSQSVNRIRQTDRRRRLPSVLTNSSEGSRRVERRGTAAISGARVSPPDLRRSSEEEGSMPRVQPTVGTRRRRDSWISRMLKSR